MKHWRLALLLLVALAQLAVPGSLIWKREQTLGRGSVWKFRTAPVDPVDAFRGRYIALEFEVETHELHPPPDPALYHTVFVTFKRDAEEFAEVDQVLTERPTSDDFITCRLNGNKITLPFNKYWVTERDAPAAEAAYRAQTRRDKRNAFVTVRVFRGDAALKQLYLDSQPLGEFLRANGAAK